MAGPVARAIKQTKPFTSDEEEVVLALQMACARVFEPWAQFLKRTCELTPSQYNVLRILRGAHPAHLACGDISDRLVARDPDVTRLVDRLAARGLVARARHPRDRRVVGVGITHGGLALLAELDPHVERFPKAVLGGLGKSRLSSLRRLLGAVLTSPVRFP